MSLITAHNLAKSYGAVDLFKDVDLSIPQQARIAIVGANGIGKTTLLRLLVGLEEPSRGTIQRARQLSLGYLPQEASLPGEATLWQACLEAIQDILDKESELHELENALRDPSAGNDLLARYGQVQETFERMGGYTYEVRIRQTLSGLGFGESDYQRPVHQLSGGQRTRAFLARLLLSQPKLLILDEPTNHLDIQAVEWLEGGLSQWEGSVLVVSHDRYFLDRVVNQIWEMSSSGLELYHGNYSAYLQQRQERWNLRQQLFETEKERLEKELDYIQRNIAGQNTLQAKGRLRRLSRTLAAIEKGGLQAVIGKKWAEVSSETGATSQMMNLEQAIHRVHALRNPDHRPPRLGLNLRSDSRSGDLVLRTYDVRIGYADDHKTLFRVPDLILKRNECAALIGPNGAGKTTFLKTLLGKLPPLNGEIQLGSSLEVAYFAQAHEDLKADRTLMEEIEAVAPQMLPADVRHYLARYQFGGDDVFKRVSVLSGGERGRLALAKLCLTHANLLLLDEPTNHLDIPSQEVLQEVLAEYNGTILLVSHDRYLIDALATQIWEIDPQQTRLTFFNGSYSQYREQQEVLNTQSSQAPARIAAPKAHPKSSANQEKKRRQHLEELEQKISRLDDALRELSGRLEKPPADAILVQTLGQEYVQLQEQVAALMTEWEQLHNL